jgi:predicted AAA+ superfamily ATPase
MPAGRFTIITYDEERLIETEGITIEVIPAWKWLLYYKQKASD